MIKSNLNITKNKTEKKVWFMVLLILVVISRTSPVAAVITSNPLLPPDTGVYTSQQDVFAVYQGASLEITATDAVLDPLAETAVRTQYLTVHEMEQFDLTLTADFTISTPGPAISSTPAVFSGVAVTITSDKWGVTTGDFQTEIVSMDLSGIVDGRQFVIRENPVLASPGRITVTDLGGGLYQIDSFFDLFTEVSVDGGQSWTSSAGSARIVLVPEPATVLLLGLGALTLRKKR